MIFRLLVSIGLYAASGCAAALSDHYECEVNQITNLDDAGILRDASGKTSKATLFKSLLGKTFVVDRSTGKIHGGWLHTSEFVTVTIISNGRESNQFRAVYVGRPPTSVTTFLYIREKAESERKPFLVLDSSFVELTFSGTCK